jgi:hypothetical protein
MMCCVQVWKFACCRDERGLSNAEAAVQLYSLLWSTINSFILQRFGSGSSTPAPGAAPAPPLGQERTLEDLQGLAAEMRDAQADEDPVLGIGGGHFENEL